MNLFRSFSVGSLFVFAIKPIKTNQLAKYNLLSKDFFLIINNLLLIVSALTIFIGTIYPMILEIFSGDRISVGPPFYTITVIPIIFLFSISLDGLSIVIFSLLLFSSFSRLQMSVGSLLKANWAKDIKIKKIMKKLFNNFQVFLWDFFFN